MRRIDERGGRRWFLVAISLGTGLILLDESVVGLALPTLQSELGMSLTGSHWIVSAYLLVFACLIAAAGKLGDMIGLKNLVLGAHLVFGVGSLAAGFAENGTWMIVARCIQGVGAAGIFPTALAMIMVAFPKSRRGLAVGFFGAVCLAFLAAGPLVGGAIIQFVAWPWIFWINLPVLLFSAVIILATWIEPARPGPRQRFDGRGFVLLVAGMCMLILAIMQGQDWGWTTPLVIGLLAGGLFALALFVLVESRRKEPLIDVRLFRNMSFTSCNLVIFASQISKMTIVVYAALYLQTTLGMDPLIAGLALLVSVGASPITSAPAGWLADRYGSRGPALSGIALTTLALLWLGVSAPWENYWLFTPGLLLWGGAVSLAIMPSTREMMNAVPTESQGEAGGVVGSTRLLGSTMGVSLSSMLYVTSGSFQVVFLVIGGVLFATTANAWIFMGRGTTAGPPENGSEPHPAPFH
ncbi:MAG: MFS transporter [Pseudomonadota bacterium]